MIRLGISLAAGIALMRIKKNPNALDTINNIDDSKNILPKLVLKKPRKHHLVLITNSLVTPNQQDTAHFIAIMEVFFNEFNVEAITCVGITPQDKFLEQYLDDWLDYVKKNLGIQVQVLDSPESFHANKPRLYVLDQYVANNTRYPFDAKAVILFQQPTDVHWGVLPLETLNAKIVRHDETFSQLNRQKLEKLFFQCV